MKTNYLPSLIILFLLLASDRGLSQTMLPVSCTGENAISPKTIKLCFKDKQLFYDPQVLNNITPGDYYQLVIEGINQNLYKINVGRRDSTVTITALEKISERLDFDLASKLIATFGAFGGSVSPAVIPTMEEFLKIFSYQVYTGLPSTPTPGPAPNKKKPKETEAEAKIRMAKDSIDLLIEKTQLKMVTAFNDALSLKKAIEEMKTDFQQKLLSYRLENGPINSLDFNDIENSYNSNREKSIKLIKDLNVLIARYKGNYAAALKAVPEKERGPYTTEHDILMNLNAELLKLLIAMEKQLDAESAKSVMNKLVYAQNNKSTDYKSLPLQFTKDFSFLDITISPRHDSLGLQSYNSRLTFPLKKKEFYYGISSGFYFSTLHDRAYSIATIATDRYQLVAENPGGFEMGMHAMFRIGAKEKENKHWSYNLGFGPGVTFTSKIRPRLFIALGAAYGEKHKFIIDLGLVIGPVDRLSNAFNQEAVYSAAPKDFMVSAMRAGGHLSLSYMLSR